MSACNDHNVTLKALKQYGSLVKGDHCRWTPPLGGPPYYTNSSILRLVDFGLAKVVDTIPHCRFDIKRNLPSKVILV